MHGAEWATPDLVRDCSATFLTAPTAGSSFTSPVVEMDATEVSTDTAGGTSSPKVRYGEAGEHMSMVLFGAKTELGICTLF